MQQTIIHEMLHECGGDDLGDEHFVDGFAQRNAPCPENRRGGRR